MKFFWGGIADYFIRFGRKPFIVAGGLLGAICLFILFFINPSTALLPFVIILFIGHIGVGFLDVTADAFAIEISKERERGKINGAMYSGLFSGMAVGSSLLAFIAQNLSYSTAFVTTGVLVLLTIIFPFFVKEIKRAGKRFKMTSLLIGEFKKRNTQLLSIFSLALMIGIGLLTFGIPAYMKLVLQLDVAQIGLISSIFPIATVVGAISGGAISDKFGRKNPMAVFIVGSAIFTAFLIFASTWLILAVIYGVIGFLRGCYTAATCALLMDITNPKIGATQYSVLTSLANVGELSGAMSGGLLISILNFGRFFLLSAWVFGPALILLSFIRIKGRFKGS